MLLPEISSLCTINQPRQLFLLQLVGMCSIAFELLVSPLERQFID